jgi:4'-phosphopantetheinyl transferase
MPQELAADSPLSGNHAQRTPALAGPDTPAAAKPLSGRSLAREEVAVWWLATEACGPEDCQRWLELLNEDERMRAERFYFEFDRREFVAAHALLRSMLSFYLDRPAPAWHFSADDSGKPAIAAEMALPEFQFNISHTRGLVAAAVAPHGKLGIDVEKIDDAKADLTVAQYYFAGSELEILRRVPRCQRPLWFFRLWTLKEAYLKAIGTGLGTPLDSFAFSFDPIRISFAPGTDDDPACWHFEMLPASDGHVLSMAIGWRSDEVRIVPRAVAPDEV